ncbi:rhodanese-like domain-containing protein [Actinocorallia populi]|uniref:rhodanese-like domain-containing protein n=1 Tax=Actinocorallia populi TaxID=2079200 RepID=UPI000D08E9A6|nr:rhodanese-like domain-containing protein [Actinocorallia populi]
MTNELQVKELRERLAGPNPPRLLDVRTPGEFATAHIPGSRNVPLDTLREHCEELRRGPGETVFVCRSGARAAQAAKILAAAGPARGAVLAGGILAWEVAGAPVDRGERQRWDLERQVRLAAGSIVLAGVLGSAAIPGLKWVSAFVGAGLVFAALTNTCAMGMLLAKLPYNRVPDRTSCPAERKPAS